MLEAPESVRVLWVDKKHIHFKNTKSIIYKIFALKMENADKMPIYAIKMH